MAQDLSVEVKQFFFTYRDAFSASDSARIRACFAEPFTLSGPDFLLGFPQVSQAQEIIDALLEKYRRYGVSQAEIKDIKIRGYASGHALVELEWLLQDAAGQEVVTFDSTYVLKKGGSGWKIAFVIAHNERERFAAIPHPA